MFQRAHQKQRTPDVSHAKRAEPAVIATVGKRTLTEDQTSEAPNLSHAIDAARREVRAVRTSALRTYRETLRRKDLEPLARQAQLTHSALQIRHLLMTASQHVKALEKASHPDPIVAFLRHEVDTLSARASKLGVYRGADDMQPRVHVGETRRVRKPSAAQQRMQAIAQMGAAPVRARTPAQVRTEVNASPRRAVQRKASGAAYVRDVHAAAARGVEGASSSLPFASQIQRAFGRHDVSRVRVQIGGAAAEAANQIGAKAYATGETIAFASAPDLHTAAHEAAHVIQQRRGVNVPGSVGPSDDTYERHADEVADAVVRGECVEQLLETVGTGSPTRAVQLKRQPRSGSLQRLAGDLLDGIDFAARTARKALLEPPQDLELTRERTLVVVRRLEHLLSVTALPDGSEQLGTLRFVSRQAALALGHAQSLSDLVLLRKWPEAARLSELLDFSKTELAGKVGWTWTAHHFNDPSGAFTRRDGAQIAIDTLSIIRQRVMRAFSAPDLRTTLSATQAITEELTYVLEESAAAMSDAHDQPVLRNAVYKTSDVVAQLESSVFISGAGSHPSIRAMHAADGALREIVGLEPRAPRSSARPTGVRIELAEASTAFQAIVGVLRGDHEVREGRGYDKSKPDAYPDVSKRFRDLVRLWFVLKHGAVEAPDKKTVESGTAEHLQDKLRVAILRTNPLLEALRRDGNDASVEPAIADYNRAVDAIWQRANDQLASRRVLERRKSRADTADASSPISQLGQLQVASLRLIQVVRVLTAAEQRIAGAGSTLAKATLKEFQQEAANLDLGPLQAAVTKATTLVEITRLVHGVAFAIQAVDDLSPEGLKKLASLPEFTRLEGQGLLRLGGLAMDSSLVLQRLTNLLQASTSIIGCSTYALLNSRVTRRPLLEHFRPR